MVLQKYKILTNRFNTNFHVKLFYQLFSLEIN